MDVNNWWEFYTDALDNEHSLTYASGIDSKQVRQSLKRDIVDMFVFGRGACDVTNSRAVEMDRSRRYYWARVLNPDVPKQVLIVLLLAFCNVSLALLNYGAATALTWHVTGFLLFGVVVAELVVHSVWTVFSSAILPARIVLGMTAALMFYVTLLPIVPEGYENTFLIGVWWLPLLVIVAQVPLWGIKKGSQWSIQRPHFDDDATSVARLRIMDLFGITVVVGFAFACTRWSNVLAGANAFPESFIPAMPMMAISVLNALTLIPILFATLYCRDVVHAVAIVFTVAMALVIVVVIVFSFLAKSIPRYEFGMFVVLVLVYVASMTGPLLILRRRGFRLRRAADSAPSSPVTSRGLNWHALRGDG